MCVISDMMIIVDDDDDDSLMMSSSEIVVGSGMERDNNLNQNMVVM